MNRLKSILVGVDFSECSEAALQQAARMARWNGATLHVLHVIESMVVTELAEALKVPVEEQRQTALTGARHELTRWLGNTDSLGKFKTDIVIGIPLDEVLKGIREVAADLIILGNKGRTNLRYVLLGSTAERLLTELRCSVLCVRAVEGASA
jgi:nucleotide-binding universal stress UspA family protein